VLKIQTKDRVWIRQLEKRRTRVAGPERIATPGNPQTLVAKVGDRRR
jgi:hypothetical protein